MIQEQDASNNGKEVIEKVQQRLVIIGQTILFIGVPKKLMVQ